MKQPPTIKRMEKEFDKRFGQDPRPHEEWQRFEKINVFFHSHLKEVLEYISSCLDKVEYCEFGCEVCNKANQMLIVELKRKIKTLARKK